MHSNMLYIVTSMQELQSSLTAFCALNEKKQKIIECWRILHLYVSELIVQVLVWVWYLTFNKASAFGRFLSVCFGVLYVWGQEKMTSDMIAPSAGEKLKTTVLTF